MYIFLNDVLSCYKHYFSLCSPQLHSKEVNSILRSCYYFRDIVNRWVIVADNLNHLSLDNKIGNNIQYGPGLSHSWRPFNHTDTVGQNVPSILSLTLITSKQEAKGWYINGCLSIMPNTLNRIISKNNVYTILIPR